MFVKYIARGQKGQTMNSKQKQRKLSRNITVALAVLIVATLCVTIAALTAARRSRAETEHTTEPTAVGTEATQSTPAPTGTKNSETTPDDKQPSSGSNTPASNVIVWSVPVDGGVVKNYSVDVPVYSLTMEDYRVHTGVDIGADAGTDVLAAADGVITEIRYDPMMGQTVVIDHGSNYATIYQNMQTAVPEGIEVGVAVKGGQKIGTVGDTALIEISESPHLHFAVTAGGKYVNPLSYINVSASAGSVWYED